MKIVTDIPSDLVRKIQELIKKKHYKSIAEFIKIAVENQATLEIATVDDAHNLNTETNLIEPFQSDILQRFKLDTERSIIAELDEPKPKDILLNGLANEEYLWLWGQINKIFPIKFTIRYLYNMLKDGKETVELDELYKKVSTFGRTLGAFLLKEDNMNNRRRDDRFSTAFPIGEEKSKTFSRFCSQFVGYQRADGILNGALFVLKFANLKPEKKTLKIGITESGARFAKIRNPLFDDGLLNKTLSEEETSFYLDHIIEKVPGEAKAFFLILDLINKGMNDREALNREIKKSIKLDWSCDVVNTQRAGVMSRLYELELIDKTKQGVFVEYSVSQKGQGYIKKYTKLNK